MTKEEALSELKSGNWVITKPDAPFVQNYKMKLNAHAIANHPEHYNGIPLTEDILLKCGFTLDQLGFVVTAFIDYTTVLVKKRFSLQLIDENTWMYIDDSSLVHICYLHELQNIYYWLSGKKELEITL